jgi:hypothetical protein
MPMPTRMPPTTALPNPTHDKLPIRIVQAHAQAQGQYLVHNLANELGVEPSLVSHLMGIHKNIVDNKLRQEQEDEKRVLWACWALLFACVVICVLMGWYSWKTKREKEDMVACEACLETEELLRLVRCLSFRHFSACS